MVVDPWILHGACMQACQCQLSRALLLPSESSLPARSSNPTPTGGSQKTIRVSRWTRKARRPMSTWALWGARKLIYQCDPPQKKKKKINPWENYMVCVRTWSKVCSITTVLTDSSLNSGTCVRHCQLQLGASLADTTCITINLQFLPESKSRADTIKPADQDSLLL
jgi:hypothetical protein